MLHLQNDTLNSCYLDTSSIEYIISLVFLKFYFGLHSIMNYLTSQMNRS